MSARGDAIERLWRTRPRSRFLRVSSLWLGAGAALSLWMLRDGLADLVAARRLENLARFLRTDARPAPLQEGGSASELFAWAGELWRGGAGAATANTLAIAVVAIVLAGLWGGVLALFGARDLASADPFAPLGVGRRRGWRTVVAHAARLAGVLARATPEYVLAFLLLALFGANAWPAILALALHNAGILGRLGAEAVEDLERRPLRALTQLGAGRAALLVAGVLPLVFGRFLLYLLYRFETCLREATVLGMLGIASLGAAVEEARARQRYDELLFLLLVAAALVVAVDLASQVARRWLRAER